MRSVAVVLLVVFGLGLPLLFLFLLRRHRNEMFVDQLLRVRGEGETAMTNPHISIRRRYRKLYEDFTPNCNYWKVVLLARKLALATIGILLTNKPESQVPFRGSRVA